jgi:hypothetical protein
MLHACVKRFDVMCVRGNILGWEGEVNAAIVNCVEMHLWAAVCCVMYTSLELSSPVGTSAGGGSIAFFALLNPRLNSNVN